MEYNFTKILTIIVISYLLSIVFFPQKKEKENFCFLGIGDDCGTKTTNVNKTLNETVSNILKSNAQKCGATTGVQQMIDISKLKAKGKIVIDGVGQDSMDKFDFSCMQTAENQVDLQKNVNEKIKNDLVQKTSGYQFQPSELTSINEAINKVTTNVDIKNVASCISEKFINNKISINDLESTNDGITVKNVAQKAIMAGTSQCMQLNSDATTAIEDIQKTFDTKTEQVAKGVDMFASITALGTAYITGIIICVVCLSIVSMVSSIGLSGGFSKSKGNNVPRMFSPQPMYMPTQPMYIPPQPNF